MFEGSRPRRIDPRVIERACDVLDLLDAAASPADLLALPGLRAKKLKGDRAGQWSLRVNDQYRICFRWTTDGPADVEFCDYH